MKQLSILIRKISSNLDKLAGVCFFAVMLLIVTNIISRSVFNQPILGTYEFVGFLTAAGVGLALAHCAYQDGHIAVSFVMERLPIKIQTLGDFVLNTVSLVFWMGVVWSLIKYGQAMKLKGLVSLSAEVAVYPFIYLVAFGLSGLCLVLFFKVLLSSQEILKTLPINKLAFDLNESNIIKRVEQ